MAELLLERSQGLLCADPGLADGLDRIGVALADSTRRNVLVHLLDGSRRPSELAVAIGTSRSNLSNHLACLRGCGLIAAEKDGRHLHYRLVSEQFADALRMLLGVASALPACGHPQDEPDAPRSMQLAQA